MLVRSRECCAQVSSASLGERVAVHVRFVSILVFDLEVADAIPIAEHIIDESIELGSIGCDDGWSAAHTAFECCARHAPLLWRDKRSQQKDVSAQAHFIFQFIRTRIRLLCI